MSLTWYPWFPNDWLASARVRTLSWEEKGLYRELLDWQWQSPDCKIDANALRSLCERIEPTDAVLSFFERDENGRIFNRKLRDIWKNAKGKSAKAVESARRRWHANAMRTQCEGICSPSPSPSPSPSLDARAAAAAATAPSKAEMGIYGKALKSLREGHPDFLRVHDMALINALRTADPSKWQEAIASVCLRYAGAKMDAPVAVLLRHLDGPPAKKGSPKLRRSSLDE